MRPFPARWDADASPTMTVVVPWLLARGLVVGGLLLARHVVDDVGATRPAALRDGLLGWDAAWYRDIAASGYDAVPKEGLRFFPLVPLLTRPLAWLPAVDHDLALLVLSSAAALVAAFLLFLLARGEHPDPDVARRAVWLLSLAPFAFVFVMGYAESMLLALAVAAFLALRRRRWWWAVLAGFGAGLTRPVGVLLAVPAAIEAARDLRRATRAERVGRLAAVLAPFAGAATYLVWALDRTDELLYPFRAHERTSLRGETVTPFESIAEAVVDAFSGDRPTAALHLVSVVLLAGLLVVLARRWPASYTAYAAVVVLTALTASNLDSLERYALSTFPFALAGATVTSRPTVERVVLVCFAAGLVATSVLAFTGVLVP